MNCIENYERPDVIQRVNNYAAIQNGLARLPEESSQRVITAQRK